MCAAKLEYITGETEFLVQQNVMMECEQYGYFGRTVPTITWFLGNDEIDADPTYTITTRPGTKFIQSGGETADPSVISQLSFFAEDESLSGTYICQAGRTIRTIPIQIVDESKLYADRLGIRYHTE